MKRILWIAISVVVLLLLTARLEIWHIYLLTCVSAAFGTLQWPAFAA